MAFPTIPTTGNGRLVSNVQANTTATRTFPAFSGLTFAAGDLLIAVCIAYQTSTGTNAAFSGWSSSFVERHDSATSTTMAIGVATKIADGTETGSLTVTQAGTITGHAAMFLMSIPAGEFDSATVPEFGTRASGTNSAADPPSLSPSWGAADTLWIEVAGVGETSTGGTFTGLTGVSTNYGNSVITSISADAVGGLNAGIAFRQNNTATEDPDTMSADTSNARWGALTIAIKPGVNQTCSPSGITSAETFGTPTITGGAPQLVVEAVSPAIAGGSTDPWTTASFVPPVNSLLVCVAVGDWFSGTPTLTWSSTGLTGLTFTQQVQAGANNAGIVQIRTVDMRGIADGSTSMTVSVDTSIASNLGSLKVFVVTGWDTTTPVETIGSSPSNVTTDPLNFTAVAGLTQECLVVAGVVDWAANGNLTSSDTFEAQNSVGNLCRIVMRKATNPTSGSVTVNVDSSGSPVQYRWAAIAIRRNFAAGAGSQTVDLSSRAIASAEAFGTVAILNQVSPPGIASAEALGTPVAVQNISVSFTGLTSAEAFGTPTIPFTLPFVTAVSADGRSLVDQFGDPIIPQFDTIWPMVQQAGNTARNGGSATWQQDIDFWVSNRASQGWNALKFNMFGQTVNGAPNDDSRTWDTIFPFGSSGSGTSNANPSSGQIEAYWQRLDYLIDAAAAAGLSCFIHIFYANDVDTGLMSGKATSEFQALGTFLGNRYKGKPNIVWVIGGDYFDTSITQIEALRTNMIAAGDSHLWTVQNWADDASNDWTTSRKDNSGVTQQLGTDITDLNSLYTYEETYSAAQAAYAETPTIPAIWYDGYYDQDSGDQLKIRRFNGWSFTYGAPGAQYGSEGLWAQPSGWRTEVASPNTVVGQIIAMRQAIAEYDRWADLIPDTSSSFITAGRGSGSTFVTGGKTADGNFAMIYIPVASTAITVDTTQMTAGYTVTWVDPTNGSTVSGTPGTSFSRGSNAAGSTDWILVLSSGGAITASPSAISSGEAFGTLVANVKQSVSATAISSAEAFGTAVISTVISLAPTGIVSAGAFGTSVLSMTIILSPSAIASLGAFGTPVISAAITLNPTAIASLEVFGTVVITRNVTSSPSAISSAEVFGVVVIGGTIALSPSAIGSTEAFGTPVASFVTMLAPTTIGSSEAFGVLVISSSIISTPNGIVSAQAFGAVIIGGTVAVSPTGITTSEAFGATVVSFVTAVSPSGVTTAETFGTLTISGVIIVSPSGVNSNETFGTAIISGVIIVSPNGITNAEALGNPVASFVTALLPTGISSSEAFGTVTIIRTVIVSPTEIVTLEAFGVVTIGGLITLSPSGISSAAGFGNPVSSSVFTMSPVGISSVENFGTLILSTVVTVSPQGVTTQEALGQPVFSAGGIIAQPTAIGSAEVVGIVALALSVTLGPDGIPIAVTFGVVTVVPGGIVLDLVGISTGETFGAVTIIREKIIVPSAVNTRTTVLARIRQGPEATGARGTTSARGYQSRSEARNV